MSNNEVQLQRFACLLPVAAKEQPEQIFGCPCVTLAPDAPTAKTLAADAGLIMLGQLDINGQVIPI